MAARGMGSNYGLEKDPSSRKVSFEALAGAVASKLHYEKGLSAQSIGTMHPEEFASLSGHPGIDQNKTAQLMRAYEHYNITSNS